MERRDLIKGYAAALFGVAEAEGDLDRVADELFRFSKTLEQNHDLRSALTDIAVPADRKQALLADLLGDRVSPHTRNIIDFVVSQGRTRELGQIVESLSSMAAGARDRQIAEVRSAVALSDEQRQRLAEALSKATGKKVEVKAFVDPSVIGGVVAKVGDQVIDGSVRRRLEEFKDALTSAE